MNLQAIDKDELVKLWGLSKMALAAQRATAYDRKVWTACEYNRTHPQFTKVAVWKMIERMKLDVFVL